ncbi:MAG TPA: GspMb/PilO family protein [Vicinamibacterales bacterium]|nr:GspMb/PilO family protein [Vicinamibacterales bacterium]
MTPLMRRVLDENRRLILPIAIAFVVNVLAYGLIVYPRGVKAAGAADRANVAASSLAAAEREQAAAQALVRGKARADEELASFYQKVLPTSHEEAQRMTFVSLPALARKTVVDFFRRTEDLDKSTTRRDERLEHLVITMVLQGSYEDFRQFIYELESAPEFLIVDDVVLSERGPNEPLLFTLTLSTYFRSKGNGA